MQMTTQTQESRNNEQGMSLVELMIGMVILVTGMSALVGLIIMGIGNNNKAKTDTGSTMAAQLVLETITGKVPAPNMNVTVNDCVGNAFIINANPANNPGAGAQLDNTGAIDFLNQTNAAVPAGYKMLYRSCVANGVQTVYDVRWNILKLNDYSKVVTVSSRPAGAANANGTITANRFERPVLLRTIAVAGN